MFQMAVNENIVGDKFDRISLLYPSVNEEITPLPRSWSPKDKYNYIGLSQNNLRVHYKGHGKTHKDAASVRASHPIPPACGLYYFEVRIISKGRDGYMGIGLSAQGVNMNRLPGWDKHSYGYHGDDGHSFCSSGTGQPYGPTFTTGDVIGCGVNLIDNTAFYTKNGHHLGIAFTELPPNLYPTVGLQTPGEVVDANFGQSPFVFDIEDMMKEIQRKVEHAILDYCLDNRCAKWETVLKKMISSYLVHHGYCSTAEAFAQRTGQKFDEEITSIKNRQKILKLVLSGRMGEAIEVTMKLYPGLLENNRNLLFMLKCRQFIEMVNGTDSEVAQSQIKYHRNSSSSNNHHNSNNSNNVIHNSSTCNNNNNNNNNNSSNTNGVQVNNAAATVTHNIVCSPSATPPRHSISPQPTSVIQSTKSLNINKTRQIDLVGVGGSTTASVILNGDASVETVKNGICDDVEMVSPPMIEEKLNGTCNGYQNGTVEEDDEEDDGTEDMDVDFCVNTSSSSSPSPKKELCGGSKRAVERMLEFGRELFLLSVQLRQEFGKNETNKKMLKDAFSLLAYSNPWGSPVGWQLDPSQRESICGALNSAILEACNMARQPPLESAIGHAVEVIALMSRSGLGSCAFSSVKSSLLKQTS